LTALKGLTSSKTDINSDNNGGQGQNYDIIFEIFLICMCKIAIV